MPQKHTIANVGDIEAGGRAEFTAGGRIIALFFVDGHYYAIDGMCAHAGGPLGEGTLDGSTITCPWHGWQYDVKTGQHCLTPAICQESFPIEIDGDKIIVELP